VPIPLKHPKTPAELADLLDEPYDREEADGTVVICCPAHSDNNPSLVVGHGTRGRAKHGLILHCRAGCSYESILAALVVQGIDPRPVRQGNTPDAPDDDDDDPDEELADAETELDQALDADDQAVPPRDGSTGGAPTDAASGVDDAAATAAADEDTCVGTMYDKMSDDKREDAYTRAQFQAMDRVWMSAVELARTPGERYLIEHRKLPTGGSWQAMLADGFTVRFATGGVLPEKSGKQRPLGPMIIARITMPNGKVCGYQVLPLDTDGRKSGSFIVGKVPPGVSAIRLRSNVSKGASLPVLVLAEGLETGLSRLVPGLPGPVMLEVTCGPLRAAVEKRVAAMAKLLLKQGSGSPDYTRVWARIELLVDRDQIPDTLIAAQMLNAATGIAVARLTAPPEVAGRNADLNDVLQALGPTGVFEAWLNGMLRELPPGACLMAPNGQESDLSTGLIERTWHNTAGRTRLSVNGNWYAWSATDKRWRSEDDVDVLNEVHRVLARSFEIGEQSDAQRWSKTTVNLRDRVTKDARDQASESGIGKLSGACYRLGARSGAMELPDTILLEGGLVMDLRTRAFRTVDQNVFGLSVIAADPKRLTEVPSIFEPMLREAFKPLDGFTAADVEAQIARTYELIGYALIGGRLNLQKLFLLLGVPGTGKSVVINVLEALLGAGCVSTSLDDLGERFGLAPLVGASVILMSDIRDAGHPSRDPKAARALSRLLKITGNDTVSVEAKFKPAYDARLSQCVIGVANVLPNGLIDHAGALVRRLETIDFAAPSTKRSADPTLVTRIIANELSGILGRSLDGVDRLRKHLAFTTSPGITRYQNRAMEHVEPLRELAACTESAPGSYLTRGESYAAYLCMAEDNGMQWPLSPRSFHPAFRRAWAAGRGARSVPRSRTAP
jgi:hypothetical protein